MTREAAVRADTLAPVGEKLPPELWHKMYTGSDRYLCGRLRALRYRGLPSQGGAPGPRVQCPVCEVIYLNLMWTD